jgi:hypothetical protein
MSRVFPASDTDLATKTRSLFFVYKALPPFRKDCAKPLTVASMDLIYPKPNAKLFIPRELDGELGNAVFEVAHRTSGQPCFGIWMTISLAAPGNRII